MKENIFKVFNKKICKNRKSENCPEELKVRLDGSLKCDEYKRKEKPIGALIRVMRIGN